MTAEALLSAAISPAPAAHAATVTQPEGGTITHEFVNRVRFVAIALIALGHSNVLLGQELNAQGFNASTAFYSLQKFDIICMYLVSGFLMGDAVNRSSSYVLRRAQRTAIPWLFWVAVMLLPGAVTLLGTPGWGSTLWEAAKNLVLYSSFWFIPNYLFGLMFMFFVLRYVPLYLSGAVLAVASLTYGANLYFEWFTTQHTTAWFGFMIYLWLGARLRQSWPAISVWLARVRWYHVLPYVLLSGALVVLETSVLAARGSTDISNALKFSNHLYSLAWFLLLVVSTSKVVPRFIDSRRESFGVYLTHPFILFVLGQMLEYLPLSTVGQSQAVQIGAWTVMGVVSYLLSILLVKAVTRSGFGRLVGDL